MDSKKKKTFCKLFETMGLFFALIYMVKSLIEDFANL